MKQPWRMVIELAQRARWRLVAPQGRYRSYTLTDSEIENGGYKRFLKGGAESWERWGSFQLSFLREMGLKPAHRLLDIGCGPLRGGVFFLRYLDAGGYVGVDYNPAFLRAAARIVENEHLADKRAALHLIADFDFTPLPTGFDYALAFALCLHCSGRERRQLLARVEYPLKPGGRLYLTHAERFRDRDLRGTRMAVTRRFERPEDICQASPPPSWVYSYERSNLYPILEMTRS